MDFSCARRAICGLNLTFGATSMMDVLRSRQHVFGPASATVDVRLTNCVHMDDNVCVNWVKPDVVRLPC